MKKLLTILLALSLITGCSAENKAPEVTVTEETETTTYITTTEMTTAKVTKAMTEEETTQTVSQKNIKPEIKCVQVSDGNEFIDFEMIDDYKGTTNPNDVKQALSVAQDAVLKSEYYAESVKNINEFINPRFETDRFDKFLDKNNNIILQFSQAFVNDYDGDGINETFIMIEMPLYNGCDGCVGSVLVFVDSQNNAEVMDVFHNGYYITQLLNYGKNKQIIFETGGCMGATSHTEIYGLRDKKAINLYGFRGDLVKENCFLSGFGWQNSGDFMYFDTAALEYRSIIGEEVDINDLLAMDSDGTLDSYRTNDFYFPTTLFGGKYYCISVGSTHMGSIYIYKNGKFIHLEDSNIRCCSNEYYNQLKLVRDIDIDKAIAEMKKPVPSAIK